MVISETNDSISSDMLGRVTWPRRVAGSKVCGVHELITGIFKHLEADYDPADTTWSLRFNAVPLLTNLRQPRESEAFPEHRANINYQYIKDTLFAIDFDVAQGAAGALSVSRNIASNRFLSNPLAGDTDQLRVRHLLLSIKPGPSHLPGVDGETGVMYLIELHTVRRGASVRMFHDGRCDFQLAWPLRRELLSALRLFLDGERTDGNPMYHGLQRPDIDNLCTIIGSFMLPSTYTVAQRGLDLSQQYRYRQRRLATQQRSGDETDDDEY